MNPALRSKLIKEINALHVKERGGHFPEANWDGFMPDTRWTFWTYTDRDYTPSPELKALLVKCQMLGAEVTWTKRRR